MGPEREKSSLNVGNSTLRSSSGSSLPKHQQEYLTKVGIRLGRVIGEGSYCKVRLAIQDGMYRMAVKVLSRHHPSKDFVERFLPRELEVLPKLNHPNIVKVYRIIDFHDDVYVFMELADGGDLLEYIQAQRFLKESRARSIFRQLVSACTYLHHNKISHRDLKCENVLLHKDGTIRITDFGFCRNARQSYTAGTLSRTFCGSAAYASPEVLSGTPYDPCSNDVWSLGVILFIMVTGRMPFSDTHAGKMIRDQMAGNIRFPDLPSYKGEKQEVNELCKDLIRKMLEPDPRRRATLEQISRHQWLQSMTAS